MAESTTAKKVHGIVAEYTSVDKLLAACRRIRDAGYTKTDAFTPFPVHGIDKALGIKPTILPWIALVAGLTGTSVAFAMQVWMNGIDYQYIISGKPYISWPAFVPVAFELTILFASFGTFFGMWALNKLPRFSNPVFTSPRFDRVTDDTFFLYIDSKDQRFEESGVRKLLTDAGGEHIEAVVDDDSPTKIPKFIWLVWVGGIAFSMIPLLIVAKMRVTTSETPRFHIFFDMDFSPAKDAQMTTTLFADGRTMRPDVPGTVARGDLSVDLDYMTGIDMESLTAIDSDRAERLVAAMASPQEGDAASESDAVETVSEETGDQPQAAATDAAPKDNTPWLRENPLELTEAVLMRGKEQFGIYCAACHGMNGRGNGLVNQRAQSILAQTWNPPSNIHDSTLYQESYPDGKLFSTITNGIRKMAGYGAQIKVRDRWAIVAYVRALQQSQNSELDLVPEGQREAVAAEKAAVQKRLAEEEAAAAAKAAAKKQAN